MPFTPQHERWQKWLLAAAVSAVLLWGPISPPSAMALGTAPGDIVAHVVGIIGEVELYQEHLSEEGKSLGRKWVKATKGRAIFLKDYVRTGKGRVRIQFTDRDDQANSGPSVFNVGEDSEIALESFDVKFELKRRTGVIELIKGAIRGFIKGWSLESGLSVRAGVAVCGIRGTELTLEYDPAVERFTTTVHEGSVVVAGPGGSWIVDAGKSLELVAGRLPGAPPS